MKKFLGHNFLTYIRTHNRTYILTHILTHNYTQMNFHFPYQATLKIFFVMASLMATMETHAFSFVSAHPPRYGSEEVFIDMATDSCSNTGYTSDDLHAMAAEAVDHYWNRVTTARIHLSRGIKLNFSADGLTLDELADRGSRDRIIIGCNNDLPAFSSGSGVGAVGGIRSVAGEVKGAVLLNDEASSPLNLLSRSEVIALLAHEIGHALAIGHTDVEEAIMYYSIGNKIQEQMAQDDYDALTYLYPAKKNLAGIAGSCGSLSFVGQSDRSEGESGRDRIGVGNFSFMMSESAYQQINPSTQFFLCFLFSFFLVVLLFSKNFHLYFALLLRFVILNPLMSFF